MDSASHCGKWKQTPSSLMEANDGLSFDCYFTIHDHFLLVNFGLSNCCYLAISPDATQASLFVGEKQRLFHLQNSGKWNNEKKTFFCNFCSHMCPKKNTKRGQGQCRPLANYFSSLYSFHRDAIFRSKLCKCKAKRRKNKTLMSKLASNTLKCDCLS